jgi:hypothetical protein
MHPHALGLQIKSVLLATRDGPECPIGIARWQCHTYRLLHQGQCA